MSPLWSPVLAGALGSLLAGLATALGALPILGVGRPTQRHQGITLGFAAGVMLAASFFSLIIPALDLLQDKGASPAQAAMVAALSVLAGATMIMLLARCLPDSELDDHVRMDVSIHGIWLFVLAITLHNIPEGLAVGVSFADGTYAKGSATALGIGIQNIPEGFAVAGTLALRYTRGWAFLGGAVSGLVEPVAGTIGALLVSHFTMLLPWALFIAAGSMISVIMSQIVPRLEQKPHDPSHISLIAGLCVMRLLDVALG